VNGHVEQLQKSRRTTERRLAEIERFLFRIRPDGEQKSPNNLTLVDVIRAFASEVMHERRVMRDAGVWDPEKLYGTGATVSHAGGGWIAQVESKGVRPGTGESWRLAVKSDTAKLKQAVREEVNRTLNGYKG
jgi:hypothetical protein